MLLANVVAAVVLMMDCLVCSFGSGVEGQGSNLERSMIFIVTRNTPT